MLFSLTFLCNFLKKDVILIIKGLFMKVVNESGESFG